MSWKPDRRRKPPSRSAGLELIPPEGGSWAEWIVTRGIGEAERDEHPVDQRTAYYIASLLGGTAYPALRNFAATGAIDGPGMQEELVGHFIRQTGQALPWIERLGEYCMTREDRGPVATWRSAVRDQDRSQVQWLRREQVFALIDGLFQAVPPIHRVGNAGQPGWHGLVPHEDRPGGWIVSEGEPGIRRVWETDSDKELEQAYVAIVEAQRQWIIETFGDRPGLTEHRDTAARADSPDEPLPPTTG